MEKLTYLTFVIGKEYFAVNVQYVLEVLQHQQITPVPQTPAHILGIINFRGDILPVIDTRQKFNIAIDDDATRQITIVFDVSTEGQSVVIAATADAVKDVIEIDSAEIKPVPEMGISYDSRLIAGAIRRENQFIMLLDMHKMFLMSDLAFAENQQAETPAL
jgi:purine-binding chemotaxis protein CheW